MGLLELMKVQLYKLVLIFAQKILTVTVFHISKVKNSATFITKTQQMPSLFKKMAGKLTTTSLKHASDQRFQSFPNQEFIKPLKIKKYQLATPQNTRSSGHLSPFSPSVFS